MPKKLCRTAEAADTGAAVQAQQAVGDAGDAGPGPSAGAVAPAGPAAGAEPVAGMVAAEPNQPTVPIRSLDELQALLGALAPAAQRQQRRQQQGGGGAGTRGSGGGGRGGPADHVLDLGGRRLGGGTGAVPLVVPPGVTCTVRNGALNACVVVREAAHVRFEGVSFSSPPGNVPEGEHGGALPADGVVPAVVTVDGVNASTQLVTCTVKALGGAYRGRDAPASACVTARGGGHVQLQGGTLTGAASGLVVGSGSSAEATGVVAEFCARNGFCALEAGSVLKLYGSRAHSILGMGW